MWSKQSAPLHFLSPEVFIAKTKEEERICSFAIALALYFDDSKSILSMTVKLIEDLPKLKTVCEELGEYYGLKGYLLRLIFAHLHELHYLLQHRLVGVEADPLFTAIHEGMGDEARKDWDELVVMSRDKESVQSKWLEQIRNGLGFHYVRHKELYEGFLAWKAALSPGQLCDNQEGAYISIGGSIKETRYYFADAAADFSIKKVTQNIPDPDRALKEILERNSNAIASFVNHFIVHRGGKMVPSKRPPLKL